MQATKPFSNLGIHIKLKGKMQLYPILRHVKLHCCEGNKIKAQEHALYFCKSRNGITDTSSQHMRK